MNYVYLLRAKSAEMATKITIMFIAFAYWVIICRIIETLIFKKLN